MTGHAGSPSLPKPKISSSERWSSTGRLRPRWMIGSIAFHPRRLVHRDDMGRAGLVVAGPRFIGGLRATARARVVTRTFVATSRVAGTDDQLGRRPTRATNVTTPAIADGRRSSRPLRRTI